MQADLSVIQLVLEAGVPVQAVMALLLLASILSWGVIFKKQAALAATRRAADDFEQRFWSGSDLLTLYTRISERRRAPTGMESLFEAGFKEFARLRKQIPGEPTAVVDASQRAMRVALNREMDRLETGLPFLASVGSTSPYIGLLGTVWGIMNAFLALGGNQSATLATVAPGIAEALIATAMGLIAAIPAVIAYNRHTHQTERLASRYDAFVDEFASILQRQAHTPGGAA